MNNDTFVTKLKATQKVMMVLTSIAIASLILSRIFFGELGFYWTFSVLQILMTFIHLMVLIRTRNPVYLIPVFMYGFWALTFFPLLAGFSGHTIIAVISAFFLAAFIVLLFTKRINWRYREILHLAAKPVRDATNGFTSRPFPAGKADFTRKDAIGFSRFLLKHVIVYPVTEEERIVLIIPRYMWSYILFLRTGYHRETYVSLSNSGKITVCIARKDYDAYKEELSFDQLCASLGSLFQNFLDWYKSGDSKKIIDLLNSAWKTND